MVDQGKSLEERIEMPSIPKEAAQKISRIEEELNRAEVEQCLSPFFNIFFLSTLLVLGFVM